MIELNNVEILSINTHNPEQSVKALQYSTKNIQFKQAKILSNKIPANLTDDIQFIEIPEFSTREQYSNFTFNHLSDYVQSEYVLMIHDDGFIINSHLWTDEFLKYDYIGAPWPGSIEQTEKRVGNGGFCIRSKRLLEFCKTLDAQSDYDDWAIGVTQNDYLKQQGFTFAPISVAMRFSLESAIPECEFNLDNAFGFHGKRHTETQNMANLLNYII